MAETYCNRYTHVAVGYASGNKPFLITRLRCGMWDCPYCADVNRRQWSLRVATGVEQLGGKWSFWTLTQDLVGATRLEQRQRLATAWNRLRGKIVRRIERKLHYVRVMEIGSRGTRRMHMHLLMDYVPPMLHTVTRRDGSQYTCSLVWDDGITRSGFGRVYDIKDVSSIAPNEPDERIAYITSYVTKYMTKMDSVTRELMPKYTRRFSLSRNWPELDEGEEFDPDYNWEVKKNVKEDTLFVAWYLKKHVVDMQTGLIYSDDDIMPNGLVCVKRPNEW